MKKLLISFSLILFLCLQVALAQTREITGTITGADDGIAIPGVSVVVRGTTIGTITNAEGYYSLDVPESARILMFTFIGMKTVEETIGDRSVIDIVLEIDVLGLEEVVVTSLGITREKKSLGYAVQEVSGDVVSDIRDINFVNSLSGKVTGVNIKQSNTMGGSANILIRGTTSLTGNNQALFVVDGIPIDNSFSDLRRGGGYDYGNAASDINPDDIESISVLKGAAATALYGSRASNGVILITSKKGKKKRTLGISINSGYMVNSINKVTLPEHQNEYGAGYGQYYEDPTGNFFYADIDGDGVDDLITPTSEDASWGAKFDPNLMVIHWDALDPEFDNYGEKRPWVAGANGIDYFFQTGHRMTNNIAFDGGTDNGVFRVSYTNVDEKGIIPNSSIKKNTLNFSGSFDFTDKLNVEANTSYINQTSVGRYGTGYEGQNVMQSFGQWIQTNLDFKRLEEKYISPTGMHRSWNRGYYDDAHPIYFDNPYWVRYQSYENDQRDRIIGYVALNYKITDWLDFIGRTSIDYYTESREERIAMQSVETSEYRNNSRTFREINNDLMLKFNKHLSNDLSISGIVGYNYRGSMLATTNMRTAGGLIVPDLYSISNSTSPAVIGEGLTERNMNSGYGSVSFGFKNMLYLDLTGRVEQSSTLPEANDTYFYPSASMGFIFSELIDIGAVYFGKVRVNYAQIGSDAPAHSIKSTYSQGTNWGSLPLFSVNSTQANADLKPEQTNSIEAGLEMSFLNRRFGFDFSIYKTNTYDQIMPVTVSNASGYNYRYINAGELENKGIEISLNITPVRTNDFQWDMNVGWFTNKNMVVELAEGIDNILLTSLWDASINAAEGEPYGTIKGEDFIYTDGKRTVGADGYYLITDEGDVVLGNVNPDWNMGITNVISWKGISLSGLIDWQQGGSIYSLNTKYGQATGVYAETVTTNGLGNPSRDPVADGGGLVYPNTVYEDGTPNTTYIRAGSWGGYWKYGNTPTAEYVFDASYIKLRELSLSYTLPQTLLSKTPIASASLSIVGRNLAILHSNVRHFDPETGSSAGNSQGFENGSYPSVRSIGFNVRLGF
ncbi:MAG: SusC/RagA family TonB-linked outer membrane protein [Bacteroidales bacterium]|nr:SusC/RagA family TonB-linked outer membrane protein [Bacteroidales bacterium]